MPAASRPDGDRPPKAAVHVANILRRRIITGELPVGEGLPPENVLVTEFGVSRPTLRAALRILESEQLIAVRRGSRGGAWVTPPTGEMLARRAGVYLQYHEVSLDEVHGARVVVEPPAAALVAERADPADVATLEAAAEREHSLVHDRLGFRAAALDFHRTLVELSRNETLIVFASMIHGLIEQQVDYFSRGSPGRYRHGPARHSEHLEIIELIRAGRAKEAERHWIEHLEAARQVLQRETGADTVVDLLR
jgi:DNA-binding FadR family transcriptional regulator